MYSIGVDIGGMSMKIGLVNEKGVVVDTVIVPTKENDPSDITIDNLNKGILEELVPPYPKL